MILKGSVHLNMQCSSFLKLSDKYSESGRGWSHEADPDGVTVQRLQSKADHTWVIKSDRQTYLKLQAKQQLNKQWQMVYLHEE